MMIRGLANRLSLVVSVAVSMTACSGGTSPSTPVKTIVATPAPGKSAAPASNATFTIIVPASVKTKAARSREYVSVATKSIELASTALDPAGPVIVNVPNSGSGPGGACTGSGPYTCTIMVHLTPGSDAITLTTFDAAGATGNKLSQQIVTETILEGVANSFPITLDANAAAMIVNANVPCANGPVGASVGTSSTTSIPFTVAYADPAAKTITGPGLPKLGVTVTGASGGTITVSGLSSSPPAFTLSASGPGVSGTINVAATPASGTDGLSFSLTKSFTFTAGSPEPASLLAVPEQGGTAAGQLNLYTVALGTGPGSADTINAAVPATLSDQNNDVDNPQAVTFDTSGNLLIANGGTTVGGDFGNVACVPAGSIVTAAAQSTTVSTNVDDPDSIAFGNNGDIGVANVAGSASDALAEFALNGNYVDANNDVAGDEALSVAASPGNPTGTFAVSLPAANQVILKTAAGVKTTLTDATNIVSPESLAWDGSIPGAPQLAINNNPADPTSTPAYVSFFTATGTFIDHALLADTNFGGDYTGAATPGTLAVSSLGTVAAVAYDCSGYEAVFVFGPTPARTLLGVIPFNVTSVADGGTDLIYGGNANVRSLTWLSATKLLVALESTGSSTATADAHEGLYIFDVSATATPAGFNDCDESAAPSGPKQTAFLHTSLPPLATAYKP